MIVSIPSDAQVFLRGLLVAIAVLAGLVALIWVYSAEPWYSNQLLERMRGGGSQALGRDETSKISDLFPDGMSREAAVALLKQNGFSCTPSGSNSTEAQQLQCTRKRSHLVCNVSYGVSFVVDRESVRGVNAQSYQVCW